MTEIIVRWGPWALLVVFCAAIVLLVWALCKMAKEPERDHVQEVLLPGADHWIKNPALHRDARRKFEETEADDLPTLLHDGSQWTEEMVSYYLIGGRCFAISSGSDMPSTPARWSVPTSSHKWSEPKLDAKRGACEVSTCLACGCERVRHLSGRQDGFKNGGRVYDGSRTEYRHAGIEQWACAPGPCKRRA